MYFFNMNMYFLIMYLLTMMSIAGSNLIFDIVFLKCSCLVYVKKNKKNYEKKFKMAAVLMLVLNKTSYVNWKNLQRV